MNFMFYFLLALTTVLAVTASPGQPVLDINGDIISDGSYYVIPLNYGTKGGGLTLSPRGDNLCPLFVGQRISEVNRGIPVKFSNWRSKVQFVPQSENLNIEMDVKAKFCVRSTYWWVTAAESHFRKLFVTAGPKPELGEDTSKSFFQIKKTGVLVNSYTVAFCSKDNGCSDVGIFMDEHGIRRLALGSMPFPVMFMKATEEDTSSKNMYILSE
ncbi:hypothetical protein F2Q70_00016022 [Brassica cretica]|uniref:Uncharacterized protein n=1 Tax=Brassica cretica TaxID=69181 RepID=A0A8S9I3T9_BRACR|nr:hypothetical protein F2Q70_00016022 [Brassica cretica]